MLIILDIYASGHPLYMPMNFIILVSTLSSFAYLSASLLQWRALQEQRQKCLHIRIVLAIALFLHFITLFFTIKHQGLHLGVFQASTVLTFMVILLVWLSDLHKPVAILCVPLGPLIAINLFMNLVTFSQEEHRWIISQESKLWIHITLSFLAYGMLGVAALQALVVLIQDRRLHSGHLKFGISALPPLQTMDELLLRFTLLGLLLLSVAIVTGFYFVEDLLAQHLVHKTTLSLTAWCLFSVLLIGRALRGWRGAKASKWTLSGFVVLLVAYLGNKFILEIVLKRI